LIQLYVRISAIFRLVTLAYLGFRFVGIISIGAPPRFGKAPKSVFLVWELIAMIISSRSGAIYIYIISTVGTANRKFLTVITALVWPP